MNQNGLTKKKVILTLPGRNIFFLKRMQGYILGENRINIFMIISEHTYFSFVFIVSCLFMHADIVTVIWPVILTVWLSAFLHILNLSSKLIYNTAMHLCESISRF